MPRLTVTAIDSLTAMEEIVSKLGEDAVILSTRKIRGQVEISASNDPVPGGLPPRKTRASKKSKSFTDVFTQADASLLQAPAEPVATEPSLSRQMQEHFIDDTISLDELELPRETNVIDLDVVPTAPVAGVENHQYHVLADEIAQLRRQINGMIVTEATALRHEIGNSLTMRLKTVGFSDAVLDRFGHAMRHLPSAEAQTAFIRTLAEAVAIDKSERLFDADIYVIAGPHGAGKTNLAGKLAARLTDDTARLWLASFEMTSSGQNGCRNNARLLNLPFVDLTLGFDAGLLAQSGKLVIDAGTDPSRLETLQADLQHHFPAAKICHILPLPGAYSTQAIKRAIELYGQNGAYIALTRLDECEIAAPEFSVLAESHAKLGFLTASRSLVDSLLIASQEPVAQYLSGICGVETIG
jgi:hypothetical protein